MNPSLSHFIERFPDTYDVYVGMGQTISREVLRKYHGDWGAALDHMDVFVPIADWPYKYRQLYYQRRSQAPSTNKANLTLFLFFYLNGLPPDEAGWLCVLNEKVTRHEFHHLKQLVREAKERKYDKHYTHLFHVDERSDSRHVTRWGTPADRTPPRPSDDWLFAAMEAARQRGMRRRRDEEEITNQERRSHEYQRERRKRLADFAERVHMSESRSLRRRMEEDSAAALAALFEPPILPFDQLDDDEESD
jgi:hypothetical protein